MSARRRERWPGVRWRALALVAALLAPCASRATVIPLEIQAQRIEQEIGGQRVTLALVGRLTLIDEDAGARGEIVASVDLADLQAKIPAIVRTAGNRNEPCGERIDLRAAALRPHAEHAALFVGGRYERWGCLPWAGLDAAHLLYGQDGSASFELVPRAAPDGIAIDTRVTAVRADGALGELLATRLLGDWLSERLAAVISRAFEADRLRVALPAQLAGLHPRFDSVRFTDLGQGRLGLVAEGKFALSPGQAGQLFEAPAPEP